MARTESIFQSLLIAELEMLFPNCIVLKNDATYIQGFPDLLILYEDRWATLECKRSANAPFQPNQEYYIEILDNMSFSAAIYPENKEEILNALQHAFFTRRPSCISQR
jgi:hypothetical protein